MILCGIDPGTARIGWACIENNQSVITPLSYGCITTKQSDSVEIRLLDLHNKLVHLIKQYKPETLGVEDLFFATNSKTAIAVGQARGVILLTAAMYDIAVTSYSPLAVKRTITGSGKADKIQMQKMVMQILKLKEIPKPDDTADALAIALTHAYSYRYKKATQCS
jgi:crossover junction endodeoxyribonuclease RuvC